MIFNKGLPQGISVLRQLNSQAGPQTINLGLGKPFIDMPPRLRQLAIETLSNNSLKFDYTDNAGIPELRSLLAARYGLPDGSLFITHGAQEGLAAAALAVLNPGDEVLIPDPSFLAYDKMSTIMHASVRYFALKEVGHNFEYDISEIKKNITAKTRILFLCSPNNPNGAFFPERDLKELALLAEKQNFIILMDEVYGELSFHKEYRPAALLSPSIVSINSLSKSHALTGWRLGWLACQDKDFLNKCIVAHQYLLTSSSTPAQQLILAMLKKGELFKQVRDAFNKAYLNKRNLFFENAPKIRHLINAPEGSFYLFPPVPMEYEAAEDFCAKLLKEDNVLVVPGSVFGKLGKKHYRISYAADDEQLKRAAQIINSKY